MAKSIRRINNQSFYAKEMSDTIPTILNKTPRGTVHSVFNTSFNLIFNEHIIHIGSLENGLAPFGIGLEKYDTHRFTQTMRMKMKVTYSKERNMLVFENGSTLHLKGASSINHSFTYSSIDSNVLEKNIHYLYESIQSDHWTIGFVQTEEEKQQLLHYLSDEKVDETDMTTYLQKLAKLIQLPGEQDATDVFNYWMGRGSGLTPSGDDILTGASAIYTLLQEGNNDYLLALKKYLLANGRNRTTQIAYEYLLYATKYKFHSHILDLCMQLIVKDDQGLANAIQNLLQVGHTSGADTLIGIIIGGKAYLNA